MTEEEFEERLRLHNHTMQDLITDFEKQLEVAVNNEGKAKSSICG